MSESRDEVLERLRRTYGQSPQITNEVRTYTMSELDKMFKEETDPEDTAPAEDSVDDDDNEDEEPTLYDTAADIADAASDVHDAYSKFKSVKGKFTVNAGKVGAKSLVGKAAKNLFEFPVFVSSSVPLDYATAVNSLLEQMYASFLQMAISTNPVVSKKDVDNGKVFQHLKTDTTKYMEYTEFDWAREACHNVITTDQCIAEFNMIDISAKESELILEAANYEPLDEFSHFFQEAKHHRSGKGHQSRADQYRNDNNDDSFEAFPTSSSDSDSSSDNKPDRPRNLAAERRAEAKDRREEARNTREEEKHEWDRAKAGRDQSKFDNDERRAEERAAREKSKHDKDEEDRAARRERDTAREQREAERHTRDEEDRAARRERDAARERRDIARDARDVEKHAKDEVDRERRRQRDEKEDRYRANREEREKEQHQISKNQNARNIEKHAVDMKVKAPQMLDETKIQKLNTMKPLMMSVGLKVISDDGHVSNMIDYVVGVRTHCRIVKAEVLPDVAEYPLKEMSTLTRKAKWRAGEIKFFDYLFSRKEKKQAAYDSRDVNRKWYHRLYTLAHSKGSKSLAGKITGKETNEGLIPNATIVISKADVDMIKAEKNIDLLKASTAKAFCNELFLMSFIVIDIDAQSIKILLPDVNNAFEVQSLASVQKQLATLDTSGTVSKEVTKLMNGR